MAAVDKLQQTSTLRGKDRKTAEEGLLRDVTFVTELADLLPRLDKKTQGHVAKMVMKAPWRKDTDSDLRTAAQALLIAMFATKNAKLHGGAGGALNNNLGAIGEPCVDALVDCMIHRTKTNDMRYRMYTLTHYMGLTTDELADSTVHFIDHPWSEIANRARELQTAAGRALTPYIYEGVDTPTSEQLQKLGLEIGTLGDPKHPTYYSRERGGHWEGEDPKGEIPLPGGPSWALYSGLRTPNGLYFGIKGYEKKRDNLEIVQASENFDVMVKGKRHLLAVIAYNETTQYYYCVDLANRGSYQYIWKIDHDGTDPWRWKSTPEFLKLLKFDKKRNK